MTSNAPPLCRFCGTPIAKETFTVYFRLQLSEHERNSALGTWRYIQVPQFPNTQAEAQRHINDGQVVSVRRSHDGTHISHVTCWNGSSYKDEFFCSGEHAKRFGYAAARGGNAMKEYNDAITARNAKVD